jgi:hypothetical protein
MKVTYLTREEKMKKAWVILGLLCFLATPLFAQEPPVVELKGTLIDNDSVQAHAQDIAGFLKTYKKEQALAAGGYSGYAVYTTEGKMYKLDAQAVSMVEEFLKKKGNDLKVTVKVQQFTEDLSLVSVEKQK